MPIISQKIISNVTQSDGRVKVTYEFTSDIGEKAYLKELLLDSALDLNADILSRIPQIENSLVEKEKAEIKRDINGGLDPLSVTPKNLTKKALARHLIKEAMRSDKPDSLFALKPLIDFILTRPDPATYIGVSTLKLNRFKKRYNDLLNIKATLDIDKTRAEEL